VPMRSTAPAGRCRRRMQVVPAARPVRARTPDPRRRSTPPRLARAGRGARVAARSAPPPARRIARLRRPDSSAPPAAPSAASFRAPRRQGSAGSEDAPVVLADPGGPTGEERRGPRPPELPRRRRAPRFAAAAAADTGASRQPPPRPPSACAEAQGRPQSCDKGPLSGIGHARSASSDWSSCALAARKACACLWFAVDPLRRRTQRLDQARCRVPGAG
jgi:hypothetical protein